MAKAIAPTREELFGDLLMWCLKRVDQRPKRLAIRMFHAIKKRSEDRGYEFNLTPAWIRAQLERRHCAVTGIEFDLFGREGVKRPKKHAPSVDRIDSDRGYTIDNCQMVIYQYNTAKGCWNHEDVMVLAKALCEKEAAQCQS